MPQNMIGAPAGEDVDVVCREGEGSPSKAGVMEENKEQQEGDPAIPTEDKQEEGHPAIPPPAIRGGPTRRGGAVKQTARVAFPRRGPIHKQLATKPVFSRGSRDGPSRRGSRISSRGSKMRAPRGARAQRSKGGRGWWVLGQVQDVLGVQGAI